MKSRFPTPENIGKYPSTFGSSYADFGHESPTEQQTSEIKTFSEIVFTDPKLKQIANAIGYTKTHAESLNDKYGLPNMSESERTSFARYFLLLAISMPQFLVNANWHEIARYTNKALTQGLESVQGAMTPMAWTRLFQMFDALKEDTLPPWFVQSLDSIAKKREQVEKGVKIDHEYLKNRRSKPTEEMMQRIQAERLRREEAERAERAKRQAELKRQVSSEQDSLMPIQEKPANYESPTLSQVLLDRQYILGKISNRIGLTETDIEFIEQNFFPAQLGSKVDDIAIVLLTIALIMPIATKNKEWGRIASFAKEIQEKGAVALRSSLPEQSYELAVKIAESIENGQISPEIQAQISQISSSTDIADVTEVTSTPGPVEGQLTLAELEITNAELQALIQAGETLPTLVTENEKLKQEVEAAKKSASTSKYVAIGLGIALLAGGGYWYYTTTQQNQ